MRLPSGDHVARLKNAVDGNEIARAGVTPVGSPIMSWYSPLASENHATCAPSGDHTGPRSCAPGLWVRLRKSPFSAGTVKISPRASNATRIPVGESVALRIMLATFLNCGRAHGKSPVTSILTFCDLPDFASTR